ncbi:MAG TPA: glycoside hydrolase family 38 C-terminal domain-containing protein [Chthonomonadales bacterium]|nr:glycoside hydrolase family 38 C-terminal domain-containing protein [Chthonomonadales bacterium]
MSRRLHLICNAHLDPVWLWEWEEGAAAAVATFRAAADLCEEFEGFVFNHNEALLYHWVEEMEPALFARIQRLVREKRWHIMGGWWLQPDCNMPSGESFVRQTLVGRRYFADRFGAAPTTAINLDSFGHSRGLVQILARSGYDSYLFCRPAPGDCRLPADLFRWVGFDGSEVVGWRCPSYNSPLGGARDKVEEWIRARPDDALLVVLWGVGNHGGGPSREDLRRLAALQRERAGAVDILHSTPEALFADVAAHRSALPRHARDINPWAVGCYTSQVRIKQKHRLLENELYALEKMACAACAAGLMEYPHDELDSALRDLLTAQFHDILPGSSIQAVEEMALRTLDHGLETVSRAKGRAFFALATGQPPAADGEIPVLVYNPHPFPVRRIVECEFQLADQNWADTFTLPVAHQDGQPLPTQCEKEAANLNLDWRKRIAFEAELAPSSMNRFDCRLTVLPAKPAPDLRAEGGSFSLRSDVAEWAVSSRTGLLERYAVGGVDYLLGRGFQPLVMRDNEDPWGMTVRGFRTLAGRFRLLGPSAAARLAGVRADRLPPVRVIEDGDVRTVIEALLGFASSAVVLRYRIPRRGSEFEVEARVHWNVKDRALKLLLPVTLRGATYYGQVAYGAQELPSNGDEAVSQKWSAVISSDRTRALTVINDGVYGSDFSRQGLRLTLLRSPAYAGHPIHDRPVVPQDRYTERIDQGERLFRFWVNAGPARERLERVDREALAHNEKPMAISFFPSGAGQAQEPFVTLSGGGLQLSAMKRAEDGDGMIARIFEPSGHRTSAVLSIPALRIEETVTLGAFEVRTYRVGPASRRLTECDLMERPLARRGG